MGRDFLIAYHQGRAAELYGYTRWVMGKAAKQRGPFEAGFKNDYYPRLNQFRIEAELAATHAATARMLLGVE
jgi:hypothetical protein